MDDSCLQQLGWNAAFAKAFEPLAKNGYQPGLITTDNKISYGVLLGDLSEIDARITGKVWHDARIDAELPAVGDWVALSNVGEEDEIASIQALLPRRTCFMRKEPGKSTQPQVIAANVDYVFVVTAPDSDFNIRRLERYLMIIRRSGAQAVLLLNKTDTVDEQITSEAIASIREISRDVPIHRVSAATGDGLEVFQDYLKPGVVITLVGSSGVGKSTITNALLGEQFMWTSEVNALTGKGRHTTTARQLILLKGGGILIDNPGIREVQMWTDEKSLRDNFKDIDALAAECRFHDCKHSTDTGCRIREALEKSELSEERYLSYLDLEDEIAKLESNRKKRQMTLARVNKRGRKSRLKNLNDRREQREEEPM